MATLATLKAQAANHRAIQRGLLDSISRPGSSGTAAGFMPGIGPDGMRTKTLSEIQGGLPIRHGLRAGDDILDRSIAMQGGNPFENQMRAILAQSRSTGGVDGMGQRGGGFNDPSQSQYQTPFRRGEDPQQDLLAEYAAQYQQAIDEANAANDARYEEAKGLQTSLGQRNQERVSNWGTAASEDIDDRLQGQLGNSLANLAASGLSGSTIHDAFALRAAKDTAREQQRVSEMRDSRLAEYDTRDTGALAGIIERRHDEAPPINDLYRMSLEYGLSGNGEGLDALESENATLREQLAQRQPQQVQLPETITGFSPWAAQNFQNQMNGSFGGYGTYAFPMGTTSNAYTFNRNEGQRQNEVIPVQQMAQKAGIEMQPNLEGVPTLPKPRKKKPATIGPQRY